MLFKTLNLVLVDIFVCFLGLQGIGNQHNEKLCFEGEGDVQSTTIAIKV